ncbi:TRAP dicarboxylate transporter DctM subunit [Azorhizobium caulinodans ORS 571]|uniref:TRAP dicarboxylate transporter DctM subunit n=2 Tax=Azorhizobium caulinodans TaxID=7 RepID=A8IAL4_AZOC5|nr:TRAP dicarboxylate transporter DctM subunit [Azorhizobium caulinodans ORS 571]
MIQNRVFKTGLLCALAVALSTLGPEMAFAADGGLRAFVTHNMAPIMFGALVIFLLLGYPVAFALAANGLVFGVIGIELGLFRPDFLQALPERVYGTMNNEVLLAVPFFTFMGLILERSGMAEDLLDTIGQVFGSIRGGLAYAVIFVGALLAATTGVVAASVISMGLISLPIMLRYGYDRRVASGVIAASGTLAQIIPPSLVLIVMADQLNRSVGDMYEGAFVPGLLLAGLYAFYIFLVSAIFPSVAPGLPLEAQTLRDKNQKRGPSRLLGAIFAAGFAVLIATGSLPGLTAGSLPGAANLAVWGVGAFVLFYFIMSGTARLLTPSLFIALSIAIGISIAVMERSGMRVGSDYVVLAMSMTVGLAFVVAVINRVFRLGLLSKLAEQVIFVMVPPLALIFLVLGTIFIGVATPTEGGAMGSVGALLLAAGRGRLKFDLMRQATYSTAKLSAFVLFILLGSRVFSLTFYGVDGHRWVEELLVSLPGGQTGFLIVVNILVFLLAFFLDYFELAFIIIPLLGPAADKLGIDLIWFGVMLAVNMQTSFMHPPFGFALFFLRSVAPKVPYLDRVTGKRMEPVTTGQIYWGAVPFVGIQLIMVALVVLFPGMVTHYKSSSVQLDQGAVQKQFDNLTPDLDSAPPPPALDFGAPK